MYCSSSWYPPWNINFNLLLDVVDNVNILINANNNRKAVARCEEPVSVYTAKQKTATTFKFCGPIYKKKPLQNRPTSNLSYDLFIIKIIQLTAAWRREAYLRICVTEEHGCASDDETTTVKLHCSKTHHHFIFSLIERKLQWSIRIWQMNRNRKAPALTNSRKHTRTLTSAKADHC